MLCHAPVRHVYKRFRIQKILQERAPSVQEISINQTLCLAQSVIVYFRESI